MDATVVDLARTQLGLVSRDQLQGIGVTDRMVHARLRSGAWSRLRTGVYVVGAVPSSWEQAVLGACLAAGPDAAASHRTSARLAGLVTRSGRIEILIDSHRRVRLRGVTVHRSILVPELDVTRHGPIPVTTLERTLVDLAPHNGVAVMGRWIDQGLREQALDLTALATCCNRLTVNGRPAPTSTMTALALRSPGHDPGRSALESRAIAALAERGLPEPTRQHWVRRPGGDDAYIDLAYPSLRLAIELDGWETHGLRAAFEPDRIRANDLVLLGWTVLRFTWSMSDQYLCETVAAAIAAATGRP